MLSEIFLPHRVKFEIDSEAAVAVMPVLPYGTVCVARHPSPGMISGDRILSPSSSKKYRRSTGLPGKFPVSRLVTTVFPSFCSQAKGSLVYSYFLEVSAFHCLIAARPS